MWTGANHNFVPMTRRLQSAETPVIHDPVLANDFARAHVPLMDGASSSSDASRFLGAIRSLVSRYGSGAGPAAACRVADTRVVERAREYLHARFTDPVRVRALA